MAITTKTVLMTDASGRNISPMVNLESLYYETKDTNNMYTRHFIYENFPIYVNYGTAADNITYNNCLNSGEVKYSTVIIDSSLTMQEKVGSTTKDIIVSHIVQNKIDGTNYYRIDVSNFNLSLILYSYEPKSTAEQKYNDISTSLNSSIKNIDSSLTNIYSRINIADTSIRIANSSIQDISTNISYWQSRVVNADTSIKDIYNIGNTVYEHSDLLQLIDKKHLIPGKLYRMKYEPNPKVNGVDPCTRLCANNVFDMVLMADTSISFSEDVVACVKNASDTTGHFNDSDLSKWNVKYAFNTTSSQIIHSRTYNIENRFIWSSCFGEWYDIRPIGSSGTIGLCCLCVDMITNNNFDIYTGYDVSTYNYRNIAKYLATSAYGTPTYNFIPGLNQCGVIYYMKDDHGNEAPYDFKNAKVYNRIDSSNLYTYTFGCSDDDSVRSLTECCNNVIKESPTMSISLRSNSKYPNYGCVNNYIGYGNTDITIYEAITNAHIENNNTSVLLDANWINGYGSSYDNYVASNSYIGNSNASVHCRGYSTEIGNNNQNIEVLNTSSKTSGYKQTAMCNKIDDNCNTIKIEGGNNNIINSSTYSILITCTTNNTKPSNNNVLMGNNSDCSICGSYNTISAGFSNVSIGTLSNQVNYVITDRSDLIVTDASSNNSLFTDRTFYAKNYIKN